MVRCLKIFIILFLLLQATPSILSILQSDYKCVTKTIEKEENKETDLEEKSEFVLFCDDYFTKNTSYILNNNFKNYLIKDCQFLYKKQLLPPEQV